MSRSKRGPVSATDLMAQLQADPEWQQRRQTYEAEVQARAAVWRAAEQPIVVELRDVGYEVSSVWDLVNTAEPYPAAWPVLLAHLVRGGYPDRVLESLGRALAVKPSVAFWDRLRALYLESGESGARTGSAVALAACATKSQLDDLISFLSLADLGESRIFFVKPVLKLGGQRGRDIVESLTSDPVLGKEARALLKVPARRKQK